jgi:hypothetical protein
MKRTLEIEIECGDKTCASEPGKFCQFVGTKSFGKTYLCMLFPSEDSYTILESGGWLMRCEQCLKSERKKEELV